MHISFPSLKESISKEDLPLHKYDIFVQHLKQQLPIRANKKNSNLYNPDTNNNFDSSLESTPILSNLSQSPAQRKSFPAPWWNDICQETVNLRRKLLSTFKKLPSYENYLAFKKQEAISRRILKSEKRKGWREFCQSLTPSTPVSHLWKVVKRFKNRHLGTVTPPHTNVVVPKEIYNTINSLCPSSVLHQKYFSSKDFSSNYKCNMFDTPFSINELNSVIRSVKPRSLPGMDQIDYGMISLLPLDYLNIFLDVFNLMFN